MSTYVLLSIASRVSEVSPVQSRDEARKPGHDFAVLLYRGACLEDLTVPGCIVGSRYPTDPSGQLRREFHASSLSLSLSIYLSLSLFRCVLDTEQTKVSCLLLTGCNLSMELRITGRVTILFFALVTRRLL